MSKRKAPRGPHQPQRFKATNTPATVEKLRLALTHHQQGRLKEAEVLYREVLAQVPAHFDALHWLGLIELQKGNAAAAVDFISRAIHTDARNATAHMNIGNAWCHLHQSEAALASFDRALTLRPDYPEALANRGIVLRDLKRHEDALASYDRALALRPAFAEALYNRGNALRDLKQPVEALASYDRALARRPAFAEALANRGNALQDLQRYEEALVSQDRAIALKPGLPDAHFNRGNALHKLGRPAEALASYDHALVLRPAYAEAHANRSNVLWDLKRNNEALVSQDRALRLKPELAAEPLFNRGKALRESQRPEKALASHDLALAITPDHVESLSSRGNALLELERLDDALASFGRALAINPGYVEALIGRGYTLLELKRHEDALAAFGHALVQAPDHALVHLNGAVCRLLMGDFARGWKEYEWRWQEEQQAYWARVFVQPRWSGQYLDGVLLAWGEQGLGDQILHLGMLGDLVMLARQLIVAVDARLVPLVRRSFPRVTTVALDRPIEDMHCDAHVPLGSIGQYLRRSWDDFPGKGAAAYLSGDTQRSGELRARIAGGKQSEQELICGLSWISGNDRIGRHKSIALQDLQPVLSLSGMRFIDLQYGDTREERESLPADLQNQVLHIDEVDNRNDIDGLAALINACDVVVTVSNATAHLAGALGKPVLLMLPFSRGRQWYWHEGRDESPWYPRTRLFRQTARGDWAGVIQLVKRALAERLSGA